jgi:hypothetical protein
MQTLSAPRRMKSRRYFRGTMLAKRIYLIVLNVLCSFLHLAAPTAAAEVFDTAEERTRLSTVVSMMRRKVEELAYESKSDPDAI